MIRSQKLSAAVLTAGLLIAALPASADVLAGSHELVVLAEPAAPVATGASGPMDLTLTWTVREIFAGEPDSVTIAVRHEQVEPAQVKSLADGGRWILLADADEKRPGRWTASMPLRATPAAVEAFRKWSAPPDVRPERDLGTVVAEVREAEPAERPRPVETAPAPAPQPVAESIPEPEPRAEAPAAVAEGPVVETVTEETIPDSPVDRDAAPSGLSDQRVTVADSRELVTETIAEPVAEPVEVVSIPEPAPSLESSAEPAAIEVNAPAPVQVVRVAEVQIPAEGGAPVVREPVTATLTRPASPPGRRGALEEPPHTWQPALQPPTGPGLPPPPPGRPLGPPLAERDDLRKAKPPADEDA